MDSGFNTAFLVVSVMNLGIAGSVFAAIFYAGRQRLIFSLVSFAVTALLIFPLFQQMWDGETAIVIFGFFVLFAGLFGWIWSAFIGLVSAFFQNGLDGWLRRRLAPSEWLEAAHTLSPRDLMCRIFVAVSAATGAVVLSLFGLGAFWDALLAELSFFNVVAAGMLFVVGMFLVGPLQAYIFGLSAGGNADDPAREFSDIFSRGLDWRAAGRFGIVATAGIQFGVLTNCIAATVKTGDSYVYFTVVTIALTPAIASYYLSAALQLKPDELSRLVFRPTMYAGAVVNFGVALVMAVFVALSLDVAIGSFLSFMVFIVFSPVIGMLIALGLGAATAGVSAYAAGRAIERAANARPMLYVGVALLIVSLAQALGFFVVATIVGYEMGVFAFAPFLLGTIGWVVGLWASGFPRLLADSRKGLAGSERTS